MYISQAFPLYSSLERRSKANFQAIGYHIYNFLPIPHCFNALLKAMKGLGTMKNTILYTYLSRYSQEQVHLLLHVTLRKSRTSSLIFSAAKWNHRGLRQIEARQKDHEFF